MPIMLKSLIRISDINICSLSPRFLIGPITNSQITRIIVISILIFGCCAEEFQSSVHHHHHHSPGNGASSPPPPSRSVSDGSDVVRRPTDPDDVAPWSAADRLQPSAGTSRAERRYRRSARYDDSGDFFNQSPSAPPPPPLPDSSDLEENHRHLLVVERRRRANETQDGANGGGNAANAGGSSVAKRRRQRLPDDHDFRLIDSDLYETPTGRSSGGFDHMAAAMSSSSLADEDGDDDTSMSFEGGVEGEGAMAKRRRKWPQYVGYGSSSAGDGGVSTATGNGGSSRSAGDRDGGPGTGDGSGDGGGSRIGVASATSGRRRSKNKTKPSTHQTFGKSSGTRRHQHLDAAGSNSSLSATSSTYANATINGGVDEEERSKHPLQRATPGTDGRYGTEQPWLVDNEAAVVDVEETAAASGSGTDEWNAACRELSCPMAVTCVPDALRDGRPRCRCPLGTGGRSCQRRGLILLCHVDCVWLSHFSHLSVR